MTRSLTLSQDKTWVVHVHGKSLDGTKCTALAQFPVRPSVVKQNQIIAVLDKLKVCPGNPDEQYLDLGDSRKGTFYDAHRNLGAIVDSFFPVKLEGKLYDRTVRSIHCELLTSNNRCEACKKYRPSLRSLCSRKAKRQQNQASKHTEVSSHTNYRYLNTPQRKKRMSNLKAEVVSNKRKIERLHEALRHSIDKNGVSVDEEFQTSLETIIAEKAKEITECHPPGSFQRLFWEQQQEALKCTDKRQMRWHPMFIKWCLSLKLVSSASYSALRATNVLVLPSERTLRDYTHFVKAKSGFQPDLDQQLLREARLYDGIPEFQKNICLVFDEMKVKEDLVYNKHSGELIGFVNIGEINEQLLTFEQACQKEAPKPKLATHVLTFLVRGLLSKLEFPYASFPCSSLGGDQIFSLVWGAVRRLEACGFKVMALTCDGASPNRTFIKLHSPRDVSVYKTKNPYTKEERPVFFISDPPHLLITVRNCWANSFAHSGTRKLWVSEIMSCHDCMITFDHLTDQWSEYKLEASGRLVSPTSWSRIDPPQETEMGTYQAHVIFKDAC